jgi:predicted ATPase/DNA-binding XRE family transcriptional regulator
VIDGRRPSHGDDERSVTAGTPQSFGAQLRSLREGAGYTQEELATIAGLSVHAVSALERGERRRPQSETVRALSSALDLAGATRDAFVGNARRPADSTDELTAVPLPMPLTSLLGRDADVETLRRWLADPASRLITLVGPGGVGKTRLALELARLMTAEGSARVTFVPLAYVRDASLAACAIAEALGLADVTGSELPRRARAACDGRPTLLVLDNFEQILDTAPLIADLLRSVAALRLLVTSRAPLKVRGEREYAVGPLALPASADAMPPDDLAQLPAVRLFLERVRDVQPEFALTSASGPLVVAICRRLDALPLALELAAPWLRVLTTEGLLRRLEQDALLSTSGPRDLPERQQTMNETVAWSHQLLDAAAQHAFRRLGALTGRFSLDAAAAVIAQPDGVSAGSVPVLSAVAGLIDKSLLIRDETAVPTRPLYRMLEVVRAYAARGLAAHGGLDDAMEGLARYCIGEAALAAEALVGPTQPEWLHRVHDDLENYRGALRWLLARGRGAEAADMSWSLMLFWLIRGQAAEGLRWYDATLELPSLPPGAKARALTGAAWMRFTRGELEPARSALSRALVLARISGDMNTLVRAEDLSARLEHARGDLTAARQCFAQAIERFQALAMSWGAGNALIGMSGIALEVDDDREAERLLDEATLLLGHAGPWFLARALFVRAIVAVRRAAADEALMWGRRSLRYIAEVHDKYAFVHAAVPLAAAAALKGDDLSAARILGARDAVAERTGAEIVVKPVQHLRRQVERDTRERLGHERWGRAHAAGRETSIESLLNDIDRISPVSSDAAGG